MNSIYTKIQSRPQTHPQEQAVPKKKVFLAPLIQPRIDLFSIAQSAFHYCRSLSIVSSNHCNDYLVNEAKFPKIP